MFDISSQSKLKVNENVEENPKKSMLLKSGIQTPSTEGRDFNCLIDNVGNEGCASCAGKRKGVPK